MKNFIERIIKKGKKVYSSTENSFRKKLYRESPLIWSIGPVVLLMSTFHLTVTFFATTNLKRYHKYSTWKIEF